MSPNDTANDEVWATVLALIWLHGFNMDSRVEWVLLADKAVSWLRAQNAPNVTECADAGNSLLGCNVRKGGVRRRPNTSKKPSRDSLLQLVSLQEASGCWLLNPSLAAVVGKSIKEMENSKPERANDEVWATVLALIWLHGFNMDSRVEWVLLADKAVSWLRAQNAPNVTECADAGNSLLGCNVRKGALGISLVVQEPVDKAAVPQDHLYLRDAPCYILVLIVFLFFLFFVWSLLF
ncbi:von Willebrand factor A domain-containing protein 5A-like [Pholidichthys leucotaenia]